MNNELIKYDFSTFILIIGLIHRNKKKLNELTKTVKLMIFLKLNPIINMYLAIYKDFHYRKSVLFLIFFIVGKVLENNLFLLFFLVLSNFVKNIVYGSVFLTSINTLSLMI